MCPTLLELIFHVAPQFTTSTHKKRTLSFAVEEPGAAVQECLNPNVLNVPGEADFRSGRDGTERTRCS